MLRQCAWLNSFPLVSHRYGTCRRRTPRTRPWSLAGHSSSSPTPRCLSRSSPCTSRNRSRWPLGCSFVSGDNGVDRSGAPHHKRRLRHCQRVCLPERAAVVGSTYGAAVELGILRSDVAVHGNHETGGASPQRFAPFVPPGPWPGVSGRKSAGCPVPPWSC